MFRFIVLRYVPSNFRLLYYGTDGIISYNISLWYYDKRIWIFYAITLHSEFGSRDLLFYHGGIIHIRLLVKSLYYWKHPNSTIFLLLLKEWTSHLKTSKKNGIMQKNELVKHPRAVCLLFWLIRGFFCMMPFFYLFRRNYKFKVDFFSKKNNIKTSNPFSDLQLLYVTTKFEFWN